MQGARPPMSQACRSCDKPIREATSSGERALCVECLDALADAPCQCPNCQAQLDEAEEVGLVLTPKGSSAAEKAVAPEVLCIVCARCGILFFDKFHLRVLQSLKRN